MLSSGRNRRLLPLVVATALTLLALDAAGFGPIASLRRTVVSVGQPVGVVLEVAVSPVTGAWHGAVHFDDVVAENHRLRRRVAELEGRLHGIPDIEAELRAVLEATEIEYLGDVDRVSARVVADRRTAMERIVEIDKGEDAGIGRGMPVVTGSGLVGTVELTTGGRSLIRLITDVEVAVGVRSDNGLGLAIGRPDGRLRLQPAPELAESIRLGVIDGQRFVTSGVDRSVFPAGIPVGTLAVRPGSTRPSPAGPGRSVDGEVVDGEAAAPVDEIELDRLELIPLADLDRLGYLTVLLVDPPA